MMSCTTTECLSVYIGISFPAVVDGCLVRQTHVDLYLLLSASFLKITVHLLLKFIKTNYGELYCTFPSTFQLQFDSEL